MSTLLFRRVSVFIVLIIAASMMVFVSGVMAQSGTSDETEIMGILESITSDSIVVSGQTISIVNAEIRAVLVIGGTVKVHVSEVNGVLTASEVESAPPSVDNNNANGNLNANTNDNSNANGNLNGNTNSNDNTNDNGNNNTNLIPAISAQEAIEAVLQVYPTTTILSVELKTKFGDTLVWEIKIRNRIEITIDAQTGIILTIDRRSGDDSQNSNGNQNGNSNDNSDDNGNGNSNDNNDDNGNDNSDDDNGGMGSDDSGGDDNGGMG